MPITVCKGHSSKTLLELYSELAGYQGNPVWKNKSEAMIQLINLIDQNFKKTQIWGLTSHYRLVLLTENNWDTRWHVIIENIGSDEYYFDYAMPDEKSPWPNAMVRGVAKSLEEAKKYLAISMNESGAWKGNEELINLLTELTT